MDHKLIEKKNKGMLASALIGELKPYLELEKTNLIQGLMGEYRQGKLDHNALLAKVAGLCVIENIENKLKQDIKSGDRAIEEINNAD